MKAKILSLTALATVLALVAVVAQWDVARAGTFTPTLEVSVSDDTAGANADITNDFRIPADSLNYSINISFTPAEFTRGTDVPLGAQVGQIFALSTLGLLNQPCTTAMEVTLDMLNATTDASELVTYDDSYVDADGNTLPDGVEKYPDFLTRIFPGLTPTVRLFGIASVGGSPVTMNQVVFEPGATLFGTAWDASLGRPSVQVLQDTGDPESVPAPSAITDFCAPLTATVTLYGISKDNPDTAADESGAVVSTNPTSGGDYTFTTYTTSNRDADDDGLENGLDTCPYDVNTGTDTDNDGMDDVCDPDAETANTDIDGDGFMNTGDVCPLIEDDNADGDADGIGDACDNNPADPTTEGESIEVTLTSTVTIAGEVEETPTPEVTETPTPGVETPTATPGVETPTATATPPPPTATPVPPEVGGAGLLSSDDGFPVWAMYVIGVAAALMLAGIGTAATVWRRRQ